VASQNLGRFTTEVAVFCASVVYPAGIDGFDIDYFTTRHVPMFARLLGDNCQRFEVHHALATIGAPPPPFAAAAYFWVTSAEKFGATLQKHGQEIYADIANFSPEQPIRGWSVVAATS
jgi:uncharacterized protein (TIGR02118 family)